MFSYDNTLFTALDRVRHALGDTDIDAPLRDDDTIEAVLILAGGTPDATVVTEAETIAIIDLASALAVEYARKPDSYSKSGGISVTWRERVKAWQTLASTLRTSLVTTISVTEAAATSIGVYRGDETVLSEYVRADSYYGRTWFTE
jgi:hypothetical protein